MSVLEQPPPNPFFSWLCWLYIVSNDYLVLGGDKSQWAIKIISVILPSVSFPYAQIERRTHSLMSTAVNQYQGGKARPHLLEEAHNYGDLRQYVFLQAVTKTRLEYKWTKHGCELLSFIYLFNKYVLSIGQSAHIPMMSSPNGPWSREI